MFPSGAFVAGIKIFLIGFDHLIAPSEAHDQLIYSSSGSWIDFILILKSC